MNNIEKLIENEELGQAQAELNKIENKTARWHYLQGKVYLSKKWYSEARKQFKTAVKKAGDDSVAEYKAALDDLEEFSKTPEYKEHCKKHFFDGFWDACCTSCGMC